MAYLDTYYQNTKDLKVEVFPSTRRVRVQQDSRETSEKTITGIIDNFIDYTGFVITQTLDADLPFELNIKGYYFKIDKAQNIIDLFLTDTTSLDIWASIVIDSSNPDYPELWGQDDSGSGKYQGIDFTPQQKTSDIHGTPYSIKILTRTTTTSPWQIVGTEKFGPKSVNVLDGIDGGVIS